MELTPQEVALQKLDAAAGANSWENMREAYPEIAEAIDQAIAVGVKSEQIYARLSANHGQEFCKWCRTVARYLEDVAT